MGIMARAEKAATQIDTFQAEEHFKTELSRIKERNETRITKAVKQKMTDRSLLMKLALPCNFYITPKSFYKKNGTSFSRKSQEEIHLERFLLEMGKGDFSSLMYSSPEETKEEPAVVVQEKKVVEKLPLPDKWINKYNAIKSQSLPGPPPMFRLKMAMTLAEENMDNYDLSVLSGGEDTFDGIRARLKGGLDDPANFVDGPRDRLSPFFEMLLRFFPANQKRCWVAMWLKAEGQMSSAFKKTRPVSSEFRSTIKEQWEGMYKLFAHQTSVLAERMKQRDSHVMYSDSSESKNDDIAKNTEAKLLPLPSEYVEVYKDKRSKRLLHLPAKHLAMKKMKDDGLDIDKYDLSTLSGGEILEGGGVSLDDADWENMYAYRNGSLINIYNTFLEHWEKANPPIVDNDEEWDPDA